MFLWTYAGSMKRLVALHCLTRAYKLYPDPFLVNWLAPLTIRVFKDVQTHCHGWSVSRNTQYSPQISCMYVKWYRIIIKIGFYNRLATLATRKFWASENPQSRLLRLSKKAHPKFYSDALNGIKFFCKIWILQYGGNTDNWSNVRKWTPKFVCRVWRSTCAKFVENTLKSLRVFAEQSKDPLVYLTWCNEFLLSTQRDMMLLNHSVTYR